MEFVYHLYFNYFTLGSFISMLSWSVCGGILLYIQKKSDGTKFLVYSLITGAIVSMGYFLSQGFYYPLKFPRFLTLTFILIHHLFLVQFIFTFPNTFKPKIAKIVLNIQSLVIFLLVLFLTISLYKARPIYNAKAHFFDFGMPVFTPVYTTVSLLFVVFLYLVGIWKISQVSKKEKIIIFKLLVGFLFISVLPALTNILNKLGIVSRAIYINVFCMFCTIGLFIILMVYANKTKDRSNFMFKIVGVAFLIMMMIFNMIGFSFIDYIEKVYDINHIERCNYLLSNNNKQGDMKYIIELSPNSNNIQNIIYKTSPKISIEDYFLSDGSRRYRKNAYSNETYIGFVYENKEKQKLYEFGFSYREYRIFLHNFTIRLVYILLIAVLLVLIGTPIFLSDALAKPLDSLLNGLRKVKEGNYRTHLPIKIHDEIGYMTSVFNSMVSSIAKSKKKLETYSNHLEEMVSSRTKELQKTLEEVKYLKNMQDGDYFLTTLLLNQLIHNKAVSEKIHIESIVKQKKEFKFKNRTYDIGGDICLTDNVQLRGRNYIVFLNADAMGKSIQGAGGILVLGSVFQSMLQRTNTYEYLSELYPEKWIKNIFKDMHKIFESFEGSMLISLIFGLIEEDNGHVYFINAEHPWLILYRDGIASYLENSNAFWKLGTPYLEGNIFISTFQLKSGDTIIMGSDGKDDVKQYDERGNVSINEDENFILKKINEGEGNINRIYHLIADNYELIDDISLMSLRYVSQKDETQYTDVEALELINYTQDFIEEGNPQKALELLNQNYQKHPAVFRFLIELYIKLRKFKEASQVAHEYLSFYGVDSELLYKVAFTMRINQEIDVALEISERIRLREPWNTKNLLQLADMYMIKKNYLRAKKLVNKVLAKDPKNIKGNRLLQNIKLRSSTS